MKSKKSLKSTYCHPEASPRDLCNEDGKSIINHRKHQKSPLNAKSKLINLELGNRACCISIGK